jgi:hypothetical protein
MRMDRYQRSSTPVKVINMADSGAGKTGALAALANAGWELFIMDFDAGYKILAQYLTPEGAKRVHVLTFTDPMKPKGLAVVPKRKPQAYVRAVQALSGWKDDDEDFGPVEKWGGNRILVIDSLTHFSRSAMRYTIGNYVGLESTEPSDLHRWMHPWISDYGEAQDRVRVAFEMLYGEDIKCNLIVNAHVLKIGGGGKQAVKDKETGEVYIREVDSAVDGKGYPMTIGRALSPFVSTYFNTVVMMETEGSGKSADRVIHTVSQPNIELKTELPNDLPPRLVVKGGDPERGLAKLFKILRGDPPKGEEEKESVTTGT